jgi:hypothetical protein
LPHRFCSSVCVLAVAKGFAPAGATKGLSDRPLETFGPIRYEMLACSGLEVSFFLRPYEKVICLIAFASSVCVLPVAKGFAPAGATKGLSGRPLETFGPIRYETLACSGLEVSFFLRPYNNMLFQQSARPSLTGALVFYPTSPRHSCFSN